VNKGGVGKTTLTYHLAHMMQRMGHRVLAVDLDPQSNLTAAFLDEDDLQVLWREPDGPDWNDQEYFDLPLPDPPWYRGYRDTANNGRDRRCPVL
jgi:cellulose biosynthesis protein BcsQ